MSRDYRPMIFAFQVFVVRYHGHAGLSFHVVIRHGRPVVRRERRDD
jgi:hypothetical protein